MGSTMIRWAIAALIVVFFVVPIVVELVGGTALTVLLALLLVWVGVRLAKDGSRRPAMRERVESWERVIDGTATKSAATPAEQSIDDLEAKLRTLERLRDQGLMTDAEYEAKRAEAIAAF